MNGSAHYIKVHPVDEKGKADYSSYSILRLPPSVAHRLRDMIREHKEHNNETNKDHQDL